MKYSDVNTIAIAHQPMSHGHRIKERHEPSFGQIDPGEVVGSEHGAMMAEAFEVFDALASVLYTAV